MLWGKMELSKRDKQMLLVEVLYSLGSYNRSKFQKILFLYFLPIFGICVVRQYFIHFWSWVYFSVLSAASIIDYR